MGKRVEQGTLSRASTADAKAEAAGAIPPRGRFRVAHDAQSPVDWYLILEGKDRTAAWSVPRGLPARPEEPPRKATRLPEGALPGRAASWDEGEFQATGAQRAEVVLKLEGARLRGRYAIKRSATAKSADAWAVSRVDPATLRPLPDRILPMLARSSDYPRDEANYSFEIKWDGFRAVVYHPRGGPVTIRSRNLLDITGDYPELAELEEILADHDAVLDGEIVAFDERGLPSFQALQEGREGSRVFVAFDLLHLDGHDTTSLPYEQRRELLEKLDLASAHVQTSPSFPGQGRALLATPGLEGIVAKRLGSSYEPGARSSAWLKVKTQRRQEFVIGGWSRGQGARGGKIGSLLLGVYDEPGGTRLRYAGNVGTGFTDKMLDELETKLQKHIRVGSPFDAPIPKPKDAVFVTPKLVCEVEFTEWTRDGRLRHPSFKGLRTDKDAHQVVREES